MGQFRSMKARELLRLLQREPLAYEIVNRKGTSHRKLESANGYPVLRFAFHDRVTIGPVMVKKILVDQVGLSEEEALALL